MSSKTHNNKLNEYINNEDAPLQVSRIIGQHLCVVLETAAQDKQLVEEVGSINLNNRIVQIKYFVAELIKA